jgi:TRAP-type C4-dicarboxylate transport system substrate-binding protein
MKRRQFVQLAGVATLAALGLPREARAATHVFKIGTLAPKASPWGRVFETWAQAVAQRSSGAFELQIFYNGAQGDEDAMVGKIKSGQLDGAMISGLGLSKVHKPILALQMPGLFTSWTALDRAREELRGELEKAALASGFLLAGWGDVGLLRRFSKGFSTKVPDDLKGKKPFHVRYDVLEPAVYAAIGGIASVPLNVPEVLPNLNTGAVNVVHAPALVAEQLQWAGKLDHVVDAPIATIVGAITLSSRRVDALPAEFRALLVDGAKTASAALTTRIRADDDAAYGRLKAKMTVDALAAEDRAKWAAVHKQARQKLAQGTFSSELVAKLEGMAG